MAASVDLATRLPSLLQGARVAFPLGQSSIPFSVSSVSSSALSPETYDAALRTVAAGAGSLLSAATHPIPPSSSPSPFGALPQVVQMFLTPESSSSELSDNAISSLNNPKTWHEPLVDVIKERLDEALKDLVKEVPRLVDGIQVAVETVGRQVVAVTILCVCTFYINRFIYDLPISYKAKTALYCGVTGGMAGAAIACTAAVVATVSGPMIIATGALGAIGGGLSTLL
ncbi:hypothetical protein M427DRAFT_53831 [Gonapodya prolifera JEL478]|uniref:Uncharacterized protein n=1 Tax=Gonapodya prolifera (strain JEL478) TaxID=1344416 RepID=A0A139ANZ5_GONPJ|nr:hypothetical protein M427DRAFT_53831 [Gonapodya prolifera JEL478]|eukprot:KXS18448.1 hypothetical protein M427DRAFT_53831 [Gonapodya prolifera JEL478]